MAAPQRSPRPAGLVRLFCGCLTSPQSPREPEKQVGTASKALEKHLKSIGRNTPPPLKAAPLSDGLDAVIPSLRGTIPIRAVATAAAAPAVPASSTEEGAEGQSESPSQVANVLDLLPADSQEQEQAAPKSFSSAQEPSAPIDAMSRTESPAAASTARVHAPAAAPAAAFAAVRVPKRQADAEDVKPAKPRRPKPPPSSPSYKPPSRTSLRPPPPGDLAAAMQDLQAVQPLNAIADMHIVRAAAVHSKPALEPQLPALVPLLLRAMRVPRLNTTRAAILTFKDLFLSFGDAMCNHVADDSSPTSCCLLALMQKATGGDLNSRRIASDANECLIAMVESVTPAACLSMLSTYCAAPKTQSHIRSKAGALLTAAAFRLAVTDIKAFDEGTMARCLQLCGPLLAGGAGSRQVAKKLAVVVFSAYCQAPRSPCKDGEDAWSNFLRMQLEPDATATIAGVVAQHGAACKEVVGSVNLDGFSMGHPVKEVVANLVLAAE